jgi:hypothetical protein
LTTTADAALVQYFEGKRSEHDGHTLVLGPLSPRNAAELRDQLPWLKPRVLGWRTSAGIPFPWWV